MHDDAIINELHRVVNEFEDKFQQLLQERKDILGEYQAQLEQRHLRGMQSHLQI